MGNRSFQAAVILLWSGAMGWLVVSKVLPPLRVGEPPTYEASLPEDDQIACWELFWDERPMGWAASKTTRCAGGVIDVRSRLKLDEVPLEDFTPPLLKLLVREGVGKIDLDARSLLEINPLGRLSAIKSSIRTSKIRGAIFIAGRIEEGMLRLQIDAGGPPYTLEKSLPNTPVVSELSPQARLPDLHVGQSWTMPVFSPLNQLANPLEIVQAVVEREELLTWHDRKVRTWLVVYRSDSGAGMAAAALPRGRMWVRHDGLVLQQEVFLLERRLVFVRMTPEEALDYTSGLQLDWLDERASEDGPEAAAHD